MALSPGAFRPLCPPSPITLMEWSRIVPTDWRRLGPLEREEKDPSPRNPCILGPLLLRGGSWSDWAWGQEVTRPRGASRQHDTGAAARAGADRRCALSESRSPSSRAVNPSVSVMGRRRGRLSPTGLLGSKKAVCPSLPAMGEERAGYACSLHLGRGPVPCNRGW